MKKLVIVAGPRSSGTRFFTGLLIRSGAVGDDDHVQRLDRISGEYYGYEPICSDEESRALIGGDGIAVLRRSIPHGCRWPNINKVIAIFRNYGCALKVVFWMHRDVHCTCSSMVKAGHTRSYAEALSSICRSYRNCIPSSGTIIPVCYELIGDSGYVQKLFDIAQLGLTVPDQTGFKNANQPHYERN